jgi:hypothetical protein
VLGRRFGRTVGGGICGGLASRHYVWRIGGFTAGLLDGRMVGEALGLQLLVTTVSSSSSSLERMWNGLFLRI